jgi:type IX secretion system PorP/SprF family membrane protein
MRRFFTCLILLSFLKEYAQQTIMYTQYTFNNAGMNPAASGSDINREFYYIFGMNRQWLGFENAPRTNFVNFSYTIRPPRSYRLWQNAGLYMDNDQSGLIANIGLYGSYTVHLLLRKRTVLSLGAFAGGRKYTRLLGSVDPNDPVVKNTALSVFVWPDIIPGVRLSTKKYFFDLSVRQITINKLQSFKGKRIGGPSRLRPSIYADYGRNIPISDLFMAMPSVALNMPVFGPPVFDAGVMFYYARRVGAGFSLRNTSLLGGILQIRILENISAGFAYLIPVNYARFASGNSFEIMVGVIPMGMDAKSSGRHSVARCPDLNY